MEVGDNTFGLIPSFHSPIAAPTPGPTGEATRRQQDHAYQPATPSTTPATSSASPSATGGDERGGRIPILSAAHPCSLVLPWPGDRPPIRLHDSPMPVPLLQRRWRGWVG